MELSPTTLMIIGVVCVALGFIASLLLNTLSDTGDDASSSDAPPGGKKSRYQLMPRLWRDKTTQHLTVEIDGRAYHTVEAATLEERQRLETLAKDLLIWLGRPVYSAERSTQQAVPEEASGAAAASPAAPRVLASPQPGLEAADGPSIVTQIDAILQDMLVGSVLANQTIRISEDSTQGVVVQHNTNVYPGINAVPEGEVKQMVLAAVRKWESQQ